MNSNSPKLYTINNQKVHIHEEGRRHNQVALLVHGWSSTWYAMSPLLPYMRRRFRCLAVDLPGYGHSPSFENETTIDRYVDILADLIRQISPNKPAVIIGHSMGGMIALTLALRHPDLIERLVLLSPTISGHLTRFINMVVSPITMVEQFIVADRLISLLEKNVAWATDKIMRPASLAARTDMSQEDYLRLRQDARQVGKGKVRAECFRAMQKGDLRGRLGQIDTPCLVIWGLEDNTVPLRDAGVLADELPKADMRFIPNVSHWPQFEAAEVTQRYVEGFLGRPMSYLRVMNETGIWATHSK